MLKHHLIKQKIESGTTLLEVLVTVVILSFGLLGLAGLQMKTRSVEMESYQRSQAMVVINDMVNRLQLARVKAADYISDDALGGGDVESCGGKTGAAFDLCEWSNAIRGAAEESGGVKLGAMLGARGCITQLQAPVTTAGACTPGVYEVTVAWQGLFRTVAPNNDCAQDLNIYGGDNYRRTISLRVAAGTEGCI
jgi:type IV pilus assembly protein PilV